MRPDGSMEDSHTAFFSVDQPDSRAQVLPSFAEEKHDIEGQGLRQSFSKTAPELQTMDNRAQKSILKRTNLTPKGNQGALEQPPDYSPVGPSIVQKIQNAPDMDELLRLKNGSKKFSTNQVNPMYPQHQMSTYHSKNTLVDRATNLDESIEVKTQSRNYTRGATRTEYSDSSKKQLFSVD